jgi:hypothetical protein
MTRARLKLLENFEFQKFDYSFKSLRILNRIQRVLDNVTSHQSWTRAHNAFNEPQLEATNERTKKQETNQSIKSESNEQWH